MEVKKIWLEDKESTIIAPFTIMDAIQDNDGISLKEYIETHGGSSGSGEASQVAYSNTKSELAATNVQDAIDELKTTLGDIETVLDYILGNIGESTIYKVFDGVGVGTGGEFTIDS